MRSALELRDGKEIETIPFPIRSLGRNSMPTPTPLKLTITDPTERLLVEQALAFARELRRTAATSPDGLVLRRAESFCVLQGREFLRTALATVAQAEADAVEKKGPRPDAAPADPAATTKVATPAAS